MTAFSPDPLRFILRRRQDEPLTRVVFRKAEYESTFDGRRELEVFLVLENEFPLYRWFHDAFVNQADVLLTFYRAGVFVEDADVKIAALSINWPTASVIELNVRALGKVVPLLGLGSRSR